MLELTREVLQATASEGLAQDSYVAARMGFEPATFWTQGNEPTTEPPHPLMSTSLKARQDYLWVFYGEGIE